MAITFLKLAEEVLNMVKKPLTSAEIWSEAEKLGLSEQINTSGKTPWRSIGAQVYVNIRDSDDSIFYQYSSRPAKFFLKKLEDLAPEVDEFEEDESVDESSKSAFNERDLHHLLVKFANADAHFKAHVKTIYHENSKRKRGGFNEWLHPDLVGVYYPFETDLDKNALELQKTLSLSSTKLFSFEMKVKLNWSNLRQCFFQAVSNSSWAHEGYLVSLNIIEDEEFLDELRRLNNAFGIGVIQLNAKNIYESQILFPARVNDELDWDTINRLISANEDFRSFIQRVTKDTNYGEVRKDSYDKILSDDEISDLVETKHIQ